MWYVTYLMLGAKGPQTAEYSTLAFAAGAFNELIRDRASYVMLWSKNGVSKLFIR